MEGWSSPVNPCATGTRADIASDVSTFGLSVNGLVASDGATLPGSDASENDQPPPTARSGTLSASAAFTSTATASRDLGKNILAAIYRCVLGQFCHQWL
jgi:hypothetical protein